MLRLQLGQQKGMADADFVLGEGLSDLGSKLCQVEASRNIRRAFAALGSDLLDGQRRPAEAHQGGETLRLIEWVNITALEILDNARLQSLGVAQFNDARRSGLQAGHLRGPESPGACDDLEVLAGGADHQRCKNPVRLDALGQFGERSQVKLAARVVRGPGPIGGKPRRSAR